MTDSTDSTGPSEPVESLVAFARGWELEPSQVLASLAELVAKRCGTTLHGRGLRLFERVEPAGLASDVGAVLEQTEFGPAELGRVYERLLAPQTRTRSGVHLTPQFVARRLVGFLEPDWTVGRSAPATVLDPSVGGGAFLLAVADAQVAAGHGPAQVLAGLRGVDIDPVAVAVTETALALWGLGHDVVPAAHPGVVVGDGLTADLPAAHVVVGNPPFLSQLRSRSTNTAERRDRLRQRWPELVAPYTDEAWLFLAAAIDAVSDGGQVMMVQPISILASRDGELVRERLSAQAAMRGLWMSDGQVFDASVEVCAPLLRRGGDKMSAVRRWAGSDFRQLKPLAQSPGPGEWARSGAVITGVPAVSMTSQGTLADLATVTAGFRDQFYGFVPHVYEADVYKAGDGHEAAGDAYEAGDDAPGLGSRLVTVGMIDPFELRWGQQEFRFAGARYRRPVVDVASIERDNPKLARWVQARLQPKILAATQTRVVEAWVDIQGGAIPATPVVSIEPLDRSNKGDRANKGDQASGPAGGGDLWKLMAVVMAPAVSAHAVAQSFGTAMSIRAFKLAARDFASLPLPADDQAWQQGAILARRIADAFGTSSQERPCTRQDDIEAFAAVMARAYRLQDQGHERQELTEWWLSRWPNR